MSVDAVVAQLCIEDLVPGAVLLRVVDRGYFLEQVARYVAMGDEDLHRAIVVCLKNLERLDLDAEHALAADVRLRHVLVPELWERIRPGSRDALRRISTTLAEYDPDLDHPTFWRGSRLWSEDRQARQREAARRLRDEVARGRMLSASALVEQTRFALAGSRAADAWPPDYCVYEPGFTYRLIPALTQRVFMRTRVDSRVLLGRANGAEE